MPFIIRIPTPKTVASALPETSKNTSTHTSRGAFLCTRSHVFIPCWTFRTLTCTIWPIYPSTLARTFNTADKSQQLEPVAGIILESRASSGKLCGHLMRAACLCACVRDRVCVCLRIPSDPQVRVSDTGGGHHF